MGKIFSTLDILHFSNPQICDIYIYICSSKVRSYFLFLCFATCMSASTCFSNIICVWYIQGMHVVTFCCAEGERCQHSDMVSHYRMKVYL